MVIGKRGKAALLQFNLRIGSTGPQLLFSPLSHPENTMLSERGKIYRNSNILNRKETDFDN